MTRIVAEALENSDPVMDGMEREIAHLLLFRAQNKRFRKALQDQEQYWCSLPSGIDDAIAHTAGLAVQAIRTALEEEA